MPPNWTADRTVATICNTLEDDLGWLRGWGFLPVADADKAERIAVQMRIRFPRGLVIIAGHALEAQGGRLAVEDLARRLRLAWENHEQWNGQNFASVLWIGSLNPGEPSPEVPEPAAAGILRSIPEPPW